MPTSPEEKRQPTDLVELAPNVAITAVINLSGRMPSGSWTVRIETGADGVPRWRSRCEYFEQAPPIIEPSHGHWRRRAELAIAHVAKLVALKRMVVDEV